MFGIAANEFEWSLCDKANFNEEISKINSGNAALRYVDLSVDAESDGEQTQVLCNAGNYPNQYEIAFIIPGKKRRRSSYYTFVDLKYLFFSYR